MTNLINKTNYNNKPSLSRFDSEQATTSNVTITSHLQSNYFFSRAVAQTQRHTHNFLANKLRVDAVYWKRFKEHAVIKVKPDGRVLYELRGCVKSDSGN